MVSSINSSVASSASNPLARPERHHRGGPDLSKVADLLGMTTDDLRQAVKSGSTMNDLAAAKGVSHDDLITAIKAGMAQRPGGASSNAAGAAVSAAADPDNDGDVDSIAEKIAAGKGPRGPGGPPPAGGGRRPTGVNQADTDTAEKVATLLNMTKDELFSAVTSGTSLGDLAAAQGVSATDVLNTATNGMFFKIAM